MSHELPSEPAESNRTRVVPPSVRPPTPGGGSGGGETEWGDVLGAARIVSRVAWFTGGAIVGAAVALLVVTRPWSRPRTEDRAPPYEGFPFADNSGVCQEWVAVASALRTSHGDAQNTVRRLIPSLPDVVRGDNLRIVRAFALGDYWTIAVDTQTGAGDEAHARTVADAMNSIPGMGVRFEPVFYSARRLYETAHVLCMPRGNVDERRTP